MNANLYLHLTMLKMEEGDFERALRGLTNDSKTLKLKKLVSTLNKKGLFCTTDPRTSMYFQQLVDSINDENNISIDECVLHLSPCCDLVTSTLKNELVINNFENFCDNMQSVFTSSALIDSGEVANYIPQLARVDPHKFGMAICSIDGQRWSMGDCEDYVCVQSTCKPINYLIACEQLDSDIVHRYVGHEPSGQRFNAISLTETGLPHNPLINAGAIMICGVIAYGWNQQATECSPVEDKDSASVYSPSVRGRPYEEETGIMSNIKGERFESIVNTWHVASGKVGKVGFNNPVYLSEKSTADRNYALALFMRETNPMKKTGFPPHIDIDDVLELYFQCCSIEMTCTMMSVVAATLANGGVCPLNNVSVWSSDSVRNCLSLMASCGMYDFSGEFGFKIGFPAKSGVSGLVMIVIPGLFGACVWSPKLDKFGNSVKGVHCCQLMGEQFKLHVYDSHSLIKSKANRNHSVNVYSACMMASKGDLQGLRALFSQGHDMNEGDYDGRTPLHLAACENKLVIVRFLIDTCKCDSQPKDRWGNSPMQEASTNQYEEIVQYLQDLP